MPATAITTRDQFIAADPEQGFWLVSKKGNRYIRDHGYTYTIVKDGGFARMTIVGPGGVREDFTASSEEILMALIWPEGQLAPVGVEQ